VKKPPTPGVHALAHVFAAGHDRNTEADLANIALASIDGHKSRRQVPIGRYIADFVCHEARLIVEIDRGQHNRSSRRETERTEFLQSEGYRILRFW
jgi:very-short-patch-repair endonuclease